jgi:hypothetical protein
MSWSGLDRAKRQLRALPELALSGASEALGEAAGMIADAVKRAAPDPKLAEATGWTFGEAPKGSLSSGGDRPPNARAVLYASAKLTVTVFSGSRAVFWARWDEFGTKAHVEKPKHDASPSGRMVWQGGEGLIFARTVHHPGMHARPYFWPTIRALKSRAKSSVVRKCNLAAKAVAATR